MQVCAPPVAIVNRAAGVGTTGRGGAGTVAAIGALAEGESGAGAMAIPPLASEPAIGSVLTIAGAGYVIAPPVPATGVAWPTGGVDAAGSDAAAAAGAP
jgi:hypothetical protein